MATDIRYRYPVRSTGQTGGFLCKVKVQQEKKDLLKKLEGKLEGYGPVRNILSEQNVKSQSQWHSTYENGKASLHNEESVGLPVLAVSPRRVNIATINGGEGIAEIPQGYR